MKLNRLFLLFAVILLPSLALADGRELATKKFPGEFDELAAGSVTSSDFIPIYDESDKKVKKLQADTGSLITTANPAHSWFNICGEATTINNNTVYYGPSIVLLGSTANGQTCDVNATGNTTEATADAPIYTNQAFQVLGMVCRNEGDANADISFTLRTAAGATVPSVTCTISDGERDCVADVQTTTAIAAGATVAIAAASTSDVGDNNGFNCMISIAY